MKIGIELLLSLFVIVGIVTMISQRKSPKGDTGLRIWGVIFIVIGLILFGIVEICWE